LPFILCFFPDLGNLIERLVVIPGQDDISKEAQANAILLFSILLRFTLASRRVLQEYRLDQISWYAHPTNQCIYGHAFTLFFASLLIMTRHQGLVAG
jgi:DNA-directed RNA polymerase II subunit RPB1